ncbi:hypothetical protein IWQ60_009793 [Tieghemiomyces parasiticus]|uniref:Uncharacterized protein n=1 Tax=Tieghemiomyces parasiticus TaxID=78921 RepID=A0A9W7ZNB4_9FUNG|nr:hypothetical protein IWQ60_009793 [Tieghemiomyces parasiticus]
MRLAPSFLWRSLVVAATSAVLLAFSPAQARITLNHNDTTVSFNMWDFFGETNSTSYTFDGPVFRLQFKTGCKIVMPSRPWDHVAEGTRPATVIFAYFREARNIGCTSFTKIIEKLPQVIDALEKLGYAKPALAIFDSMETNQEPFGHPEINPTDNYFLHRPPGLKLGLIGRDAGTWINRQFLDSHIPVVVTAKQDPGPWNRMMHTPAWEFLRTFTYITHSIAAAYALYQFGLTLYRHRLRPSVPAFIYLFALYFLITNTASQYGDLQTVAGHVAVHATWATSSIAFSLLIFLWVQTMHYLEVSRFFNFVYVISALNAINWTVLAILLSVSVITGERQNYHEGIDMLFYVQPAIVLLQGGYLLYYGTRFLRLLKTRPRGNALVGAVRLFVLAGFATYFSYVFFSVSSILMFQYQESNVDSYIARHVCYKLASLLCYSSIFWMLRVHAAVGNIKGFATQILRDLYGDALGSFKTYPTDHHPHRRQHSLAVDEMSSGLPSATLPRVGGRSGFRASADYPTLYADPTFVLNPASGPTPPNIGGLSNMPTHKSSTPANFRVQIP